MVEKMCCAAAEQPLPRGRGGWLGTHQQPHQEAEEWQLHFQWRLLCSLLAQYTRELPAHCRTSLYLHHFSISGPRYFSTCCSTTAWYSALGWMFTGSPSVVRMLFYYRLAQYFVIVLLLVKLLSKSVNVPNRSQKKCY